MFAKGDSAAYTEEAIAASKGLQPGQNGHANGNGVHTNGSNGCNGHTGSNGHGHNGSNGQTKGNGMEKPVNGKNGKTNGQKVDISTVLR